MSKNLYVTFNDSESDPTYASASDAEIVLLENNADIILSEGKRAPLVPKTFKEICAFAEILGWRVDRFNNTLVLIPNEEDDEESGYGG